MRQTSFDIVVTPVASKFAKLLQAELLKHVRNKVYRRSAPKVVGSITRPHFLVTPRVLNKVEQFERFTVADVSCPGYCTEPSAVQNLDAKTVFARTLVNSTNGRGIVECTVGDGPIPFAPLYTAYIPKKAEYRFHVFNGEVIDVQEKRKKRGFESDRNTRVRNCHNGYVYCRDDLSPPDGAAALAIRAVEAVGYFYGAVDVIYNQKMEKCFVLEVNSRPGIMGTTLVNYVNAIIRTFNLVRNV